MPLDKQALLLLCQGRQEDKMILAKLYDQAVVSEKTGRVTFSDFIDPVRAKTFTDFVVRQKAAIEADAFGGTAGCERVLLAFYGQGQPRPAPEDYPLRTLKIKFPVKFCTPPGHREYLGSILGLGLDRSKIGDILIREDHALVFAHQDVADYIRINLERVGRVTVTVQEAQRPEGEGGQQNGKELRITVAAPRLDALLAAVYRLSRGEADALIEGGKAFVNWSPAVNGAKHVDEGDMVSLRGYGRFLVGPSAGQTRKGRTALQVTVYGK